MIEMNFRNKALSAVLVIAVVLFAFHWFGNKTQTVTFESQYQAETPQGVDVAAKNAHIGMLESQLKEAAEEIASLKNKPPEYIVQTVVKEVPIIVEKERVKAKADFAIVTNLKEPDKSVDLKKLPADAPVTLNQYNVHAYKKIIRGVDIYQDIDRLRKGKFGVNEISFDWNRKISKDGKYVGIKGGYDFEHEKAKIAIRHMF
jgi:cell division protein FtsB